MLFQFYYHFYFFRNSNNNPYETRKAQKSKWLDYLVYFHLYHCLYPLLDLSDTKTSAGDETVLSEDVKGHGEDDIETEGKNTRRKKRQSYPSMDQEELGMSTYCILKHSEI